MIYKNEIYSIIRLELDTRTSNCNIPLLFKSVFGENFLPEPLVPLKALHGVTRSVVQRAKLHHVIHQLNQWLALLVLLFQIH